MASSARRGPWSSPSPPTSAASTGTATSSTSSAFWISRRGGTRTIYTTPRSEFISSITWHPDGHSLVIATGSFSSGGSRLRRLNEDGTGLASLFDGNGSEFGAAYSPQGALAYCANVITDPQAPVVEGLFVNGALTWRGFCDNTAPSWFPDGSAVALVAYVGGSLGLYRVDVSTKTPTLILAAPVPGGFFAPAVSPQGDVIAVSAVDAYGEMIWLIRADGSGSTVLSIGEGNPQWSPDASRILFVRGFRPYVRELGTGTVEKIADTEMLTIAWYP